MTPTPWARRTCAVHFYKWLGTGGTASRRTANKKLTKFRGGSSILQGRVSNPSERGTPPKSALKVRAAGG